MTQDLGPLFTVITTLGSAVLTSAGLGVWIMKQFDVQRQTFYQALEVQRNTIENKVDVHETVNRKRHEDNLEEFKKVSVALTRLDVRLDYIKPEIKARS